MPVVTLVSRLSATDFAVVGRVLVLVWVDHRQPSCGAWFASCALVLWGALVDLWWFARLAALTEEITYRMVRTGSKHVSKHMVRSQCLEWALDFGQSVAPAKEAGQQNGGAFVAAACSEWMERLS